MMTVLSPAQRAEVAAIVRAEIAAWQAADTVPVVDRGVLRLVADDETSPAPDPGYGGAGEAPVTGGLPPSLPGDRADVGGAMS